MTSDQGQGTKKTMIELRHLHRYFGRTKAVNDVSFEVERGQVFGFIGPNGAGKTTSMRILATLDCPQSGDAFVDGFSVIDDPDRVRRRLGFMPDYYGTYPNVNVWEYLDFFARAYGIYGIDRRKAIDHVLDFTGLRQLKEKPVNGLSKGMKQRLGLGRTMIHNPPVMILDEPAAGLDPRARIELREMIRSLASNGTTILVSSHILSELGEMCDAVGIIEQGHILAVGSVADIQRRGQQRQQRWVRLRMLGGSDGAATWLAARGDVHELKIDNGTAIFAHDGDETSEADLLRDIIAGGLRVVEFGSHQRSLEDVFMQVTAGLVQ
jgi:ABC-2 type transport system ATP-binding protein